MLREGLGARAPSANCAAALANPLIAATARTDSFELARRMVVLGCVAALILAEQGPPS
jgi:hypothetical protein